MKIKEKKRAIMSVRRQDEYTYDFCDAAHPYEVLDALQGFYTQGLFTDIALQGSAGIVLHCHKVALCARSSYFRVMFTADMREKTNSLIKLPGVNDEVLSVLVDFAYSSHLRITQGNVESLLEGADLLNFLSVKRACEDFLVRLLDASNCLGMLAFAQRHVCPALERECRRVLLSRFQEVTQDEEFLHLELDRLSWVLGAESLGVVTEEDLVGAVARWVSHDVGERLENLPSLLSSLGLQLDTELGRTTSRAPSEPDLKTNRDRQHAPSEGDLLGMFTQALKPRAGHGRPTSPSLRRRRFSPRMVIVGGYHWHPLPEVEQWDPGMGAWEQGACMPGSGRESYGVCLLGGLVYVSGGYSTDTIDALDSVWVYDCERGRWRAGVAMLGARFSHCSVVLQGCVYCIGGYRAGAATARTEQYDPLKRRWQALADMVQGVGNATAAVLRDSVYVASGRYGYQGSCTYDQIQAYRADLDEWSVLGTCPRPGYGMSLVSLGSLLYLVGGQTTQTDCYDPQTGAWRQLARALEGRLEAGAVVLGGWIYLTGGYSCSRGDYLCSVERYHPQKDFWEEAGNLPQPSRSHGCLCLYTE
ncbi:kelch-like protein 23 [Hypomesus transpacificus]|uniref:kelch-like protein 23 n=1 Tax=Hypomesus transpacificus TaxID=137520 RepID=UPI001F0731F1|nr:kelch-like protein 23 [Hypomesus transpacificus]